MAYSSSYSGQLMNKSLPFLPDQVFYQFSYLGGFPASMTRRAQFPRRSLKELRIDVGKNLEPLVHRARQGLERITEDPSSIPFQPTAPPRSLRARVKEAAPEQPAMSPSASSTSDKPMSERSVAERIEQTLNTHYYTIAYTLVIVAYLVGFAEYLYFRLVSILIPERIAYHPSCEEKQDRRVGKDGFHYGVSIGAFIAIAFFQLIVTISEKGPFLSKNQRLKKLASYSECLTCSASLRTVSQSMYRTFLCYGICSFINCGIIFYMVAIQDSLGDTVSTVLMYVFDGVVILYFIAFPLTTVIYHPHVHCFQRCGGSCGFYQGVRPSASSSPTQRNPSDSDQAS
ncbi:unnamed protein product [Heligmosomoides polygyrus]|uniref:G protein-coupled receptor n=1 Tax=Heligmosomoides polygyrus TaxID=6339 RepID=A0A183GD03_HELPZ|nr:unnamed protein product [Heligmosomoides polygyrus]